MKLLGSSLAVLAARAGGGISAFVLSVLLARILGMRGVGLYFLATTVTSFAIVVGRAGQENAVLRFGAIAADREDWDALTGLRRASRWLVLAASGAVAILLFAAAPALASWAFHEPELAPLLRILALGVPLTALATVDIELVRATGRVRIAAILEALPSPALSLAFVVPLAVIYGLAGAMAGTVAVGAAVLLVVAVAARRVVPALAGPTGHFERARLVQTGIPLLWVGLSAMVLSVTDTLMLGVLADARAVGLYGAAVRAAALASSALAAVNAVVSPRFAALHADGRIDEIRRLSRSATGQALLLALPILAICAAAPGTVLSLFGPEFATGASVLLVLVVGHGVNVLTGPVGMVLVMTGHEKIMRNNVLAAGAVNIGLNLILVPKLGALGAAVATAVSLALVNGLSLVQVRRHVTGPAQLATREGRGG
jgi:O-antigen/teichoic acid export membrane protein